MISSSLFSRLTLGLTLAALIGTSLGGFGATQVHAAGVTPVITPGTADVSLASSITVAYTASAALTIGSTISLTYNSAYTGTISTANTTVNTAAPSAVVNTISGGNTVSTLTLSAAIAPGATVTITTSALTTPVTAGNYTFAIIGGSDFGANFQYVGQANVVQVRALVPVSLSFVIRNATDAANTNACDLGTAATTAVSSCSYRLKIGTNAANGYTVSVQADGNLSSGSGSMVNAAPGATGTLVAAGTETYGVIITPGAITTAGGTITTAATYNAGANSVAYSNVAAATLLTANKPNNPTATGDLTNTTLVSHNLGISTATGAGLYTQKVTYTVAPSF